MRKPRPKGCSVTLGRCSSKLLVRAQKIPIEGKILNLTCKEEKQAGLPSFLPWSFPVRARVPVPGGWAQAGCGPGMWHGQSKRPPRARPSPGLPIPVCRDLHRPSPWILRWDGPRALLRGAGGGLWSCHQPQEVSGGSLWWLRPLSFLSVIPWHLPSRLPALPAQAPPLFISGETSVEDTLDLAWSHFLQGRAASATNWEG